MKLSPSTVIELYEQAYSRANGKPIKVTYNRGWYNLGSETYRKTDILYFTEVLNGRAKRRNNPLTNL